MKFEWYIVVKYYPLLLHGFLITVEYTLVAMVTSFCFGLIVSIIRTLKFPIITKLFDYYVVFFRETPLLVQLYFIFFGLPTLGIILSVQISAILAITLNEGAFISEIIRGGIESISKGQKDAAKALSLNNLQIIRCIILPQALLNVIPSLVGHSSYIIKDTSLLSLIAIEDLMNVASHINDITFSPVTAYFSAAALYYLLFSIFNGVGMNIENSLKWKGREWR